MRYFRLLFLALVLFFGTAYGQKRAVSKPVREEVIYKNIDFVDKEAVFSKGGETGFRELLASNTDLDKIDRYEGFSEEKKKEIQELISEIASQVNNSRIHQESYFDGYNAIAQVYGLDKSDVLDLRK